jgi:hypothetical protein
MVCWDAKVIEGVFVVVYNFHCVLLLCIHHVLKHGHHILPHLTPELVLFVLFFVLQHCSTRNHEFIEGK